MALKGALVAALAIEVFFGLPLPLPFAAGLFCAGGAALASLAGDFLYV